MDSYLPNVNSGLTFALQSHQDGAATTREGRGVEWEVGGEKKRKEREEKGGEREIEETPQGLVHSPMFKIPNKT